MDSPEITRLVDDWLKGKPQSDEYLWRVIYEELLHIARSRLARMPGSGLTEEELVHEIYIRLRKMPGSNKSEDPLFSNRKAFYGLVSRMMVMALVDDARRRKAVKRGPLPQAVDRVKVDLGEDQTVFSAETLVMINEALEDLGKQDSTGRNILALRVLAGMSSREVAETLDISTPTVNRKWAFVKAWLKQRLKDV